MLQNLWAFKSVDQESIIDFQTFQCFQVLTLFICSCFFFTEFSTYMLNSLLVCSMYFLLSYVFVYTLSVWLCLISWLTFVCLFYEAEVFFCNCIGTRSIDQAGIELRNASASDFQVLRLKAPPSFLTLVGDQQIPKCLRTQHFNHERHLIQISVESREELSQIVELPQLW